MSCKGNNDHTPTFPVGAKVKIVGKYAQSSNSLTADNSYAIGWSRVILKYVEGANYPYLFGGDNGDFTGWAKAESLEQE